MFLVCISKNQIPRFQKLIINNQVKLIFLPVVSLKIKLENLKYLKKNVDEYDYTILVSPSTIEFAKVAILNSKKTTFIVMGQSSKELLEKYTNNRILMPTNGSGAMALIDFLITKKIKDKKFLIVNGNSANKALESWLNNESVFYKILNLYDKKYISYKESKKIINNINFSCIIITSSYFVQFLIKVINFKKVSKIIVLHKNIEKALNLNGIIDNIQVVQNNSFSDLASIINSTK